MQQSQRYRDEGFLLLEQHILKATLKAKFLVDGIAADLFKVD